MKAENRILHRLLLEAVQKHNVLPLTGRCNLSCVFCSHRQNPPGTQAYDFPPLAEPLLDELIPCLEAGRKIIIGESATRLREGEPLSHPRFFKIMERLRRRFPDTLVQVTTNASLLDESALRRLALLQPLELVISLNSATARGRRLLMGDRNPAVAAAAPLRLADAALPFHGSVVALPHLVGWEDLEETLQALDRAGARTIRLLLPGHTRCTPPGAVPPPEIGERCLALAASWQRRLKAPLSLEPPYIADLDPVIDGVMRGTPAHRAGLLPGDRILSVGGTAPVTRVDAFQRARREADPAMTLSRNGSILRVTLAKGKHDPPGFVVSYDLDPAQVERVRRHLSRGTPALMLTSVAAQPRWVAAARKFNLTGLHIEAVPSLFFGGSIGCAGLLTVSDFRAALAQLPGRARFRQVLLPAVAFDGNGRDMAGHTIKQLHTSHIPILLVR